MPRANVDREINRRLIFRRDCSTIRALVMIIKEMHTIFKTGMSSFFLAIELRHFGVAEL